MPRSVAARMSSAIPQFPRRVLADDAELDRSAQTELIALRHAVAADALTVDESTVFRIQIHQLDDRAAPLEHRVITRHEIVVETEIVADRRAQPYRRGVQLVRAALLLAALDPEAQQRAAPEEGNGE